MNMLDRSAHSSRGAVHGTAQPSPSLPYVARTTLEGEVLETQAQSTGLDSVYTYFLPPGLASSRATPRHPGFDPALDHIVSGRPDAMPGEGYYAPPFADCPDDRMGPPLDRRFTASRGTPKPFILLALMQDPMGWWTICFLSHKARKMLAIIITGVLLVLADRMDWLDLVVRLFAP